MSVGAITWAAAEDSALTPPERVTLFETGVDFLALVAAASASFALIAREPSYVTNEWPNSIALGGSTYEYCFRRLAFINIILLVRAAELVEDVFQEVRPMGAVRR